MSDTNTSPTCDYFKARLGIHELAGFWLGLTAIHHDKRVENVSVPADDVDEIVRMVEKMDGDETVMGVFAAQALADRPLTGKRYEAADARMLTHLWAEVDFGSQGNKAIPPTQHEALRVVSAIGLPASLIKLTGNGLHVEWALSEPWFLTTEGDRREAAELERDLVRTLALRAHELGLWSVDRVHDLARIMRVPGTTNRKVPENPKPVTVLIDEPRAYEPSEIREMLPEARFLEAVGVASGATDAQQREVLALVGDLRSLWAEAKDEVRRAKTKDSTLHRLEDAGLLDSDTRLLECWNKALDSKNDDSGTDQGLANSAFWLFGNLRDDEGTRKGLRAAAKFVMAARLTHGRKVDKVDPNQRIDYLARTLGKTVERRWRNPEADAPAAQEGKTVTATIEPPTVTDAALESLLASEPPAENAPAPAAQGKAEDKPKAKRKPRAKLPIDESPGGKRPRVRVDNRHLRDVFDETCKYLLLAELDDPTLFAHGSESLATISREYGALREIGPDELALELSRRIDFVHVTMEDDQPKDTPADPPFKVVKALLANPEKTGLPNVARVVNSPYFTASGRLVTQTGYDRESKVLFLRPRGGVIVPEVPEDPNPAEQSAALNTLFELFHDFPFASDADRAHALAMPLTLITRPMIDGACPLFAVDAPTEGSGKGLLTEVSLTPLMNNFTVEAAPTQQSEWWKTILSSLMEAPAAVIYDNVNGEMDSGPLASAVTAWPMISGRILGQSKLTKQHPPALWGVSGNNIAMSSELARRTVRIRLDHSLRGYNGKPSERRDFKHPKLRAWVRENQGQIVWSWLVLVQSWIKAGRPIPDDLPAMGSFTEWVEVVGSVLDHAGVKGLLTNRNAVAAQVDNEAALTEGFMYCWANDPGEPAVKAAETSPGKPGRPSYALSAVSAADLLKMVESLELELPEKIGPMGTDRRSAFGKWLGKLVDKQFGPYRVTKGTAKGKSVYRIHNDGSKSRMDGDDGGVFIPEQSEPEKQPATHVVVSREDVEPAPQSAADDEDGAYWENLMDDEA